MQLPIQTLSNESDAIDARTSNVELNRSSAVAIQTASVEGRFARPPVLAAMAGSGNATLEVAAAGRLRFIRRPNQIKQPQTGHGASQALPPDGELEGSMQTAAPHTGHVRRDPSGVLDAGILRLLNSFRREASSLDECLF